MTWKRVGDTLIMIYILKFVVVAKETIKVTKFKRAWHCSKQHKSWYLLYGEKYSCFSLSTFLSTLHLREWEKLQQQIPGEMRKKLKLLDRKATLFCQFCHVCCQQFFSEFFSLIEKTEVPKTFGYKVLPISSQNRSKRVRRPKLSTPKPKK